MAVLIVAAQHTEVLCAGIRVCGSRPQEKVRQIPPLWRSLVLSCLRRAMHRARAILLRRLQSPVVKARTEPGNSRPSAMLKFLKRLRVRKAKRSHDYANRVDP